MLLALGLLGIAAAIYSLSVGTGGPQPQAIGGVNDVQRIFGGIAQDGAYIGPEDATTTITVFNDLQCAPCADCEINTIDPLVEKYARTGDARLEFRHFSLAPNDTTLAAIAAEAAGKQVAPVAVPRHVRPQHRGDQDPGDRRDLPPRGGRGGP